MIQVNNISISYSNQPLLKNVSFAVHQGEKIGFIGRNGHGKTTLLRIIIGQEHADSGDISIPRNYSIGYLEQHLIFTETTVLDECMKCLPRGIENDTWRAEKILFGLGFDRDDMEQSPEVFSGGYQVRLNLAKLLVSNKQMLLLDEPTNFLDIVSIRWLKKFLQAWRGELILVTHDREFMDDVVTHVLSIHRGKTRKLKGNTEKMYTQLAQEEIIYEKTRLNDEKERKRTQQFITRFRAKARLAGMVQSRIKSLAKMNKQDKLVEIKDLDFQFNYKAFPGKYAVEAENISFDYENNQPPLIKDFSLTVGAHDRIAIIGKNGKGKSTLLKLIADELTQQKGEITYHPKLDIGYFAQTNRDKLNPHFTVEEEIMHSLSSGVREKARSIAGAMMFEGDAALKKISILSGGEKARVMLAKIIAQPCQLLLLDEPSNHLDMQATDALLEAIDIYNGAIVIVTHNEMFLHAIPNRLVVFDGGQIFIYAGTYSDFLENIGWNDETNENNKKTVPINSKKEQRRIRAEKLKEQKKLIAPTKSKVKKLESSITKLEDRNAEINTKLIEASTKGDSKMIAELGKEIKAIKIEIDGLYDELEITTNELANIEIDLTE